MIKGVQLRLRNTHGEVRIMRIRWEKVQMYALKFAHSAAGASLRRHEGDTRGDAALSASGSVRD